MPLTESKVAEREDTPASLIQSPNLDSKGNPKQRSIRDVQMARDVVNRLVEASRNLSIVNSRILAKINAERPYNQQKLEAEGLGWRNNFSTKPLSTWIEKMFPRFTEAVDGLKYFTDAKLSDKWENSVQKTEKFREIITKTIRNHKDFRQTLDNIAYDNCLFGHTIVAYLDEYSFMPKHFRQDEFFIPTGTKQSASSSQVLVLKEVFLPHELYQMIEDREAAEIAGWNLERTAEVINKAAPEQVRDRLVSGGNLEAWYQNAFRELTVGASFIDGASVIACYSVLVREVDGKVSHYRLAGPNLAMIFEREDRFDDMRACATFFSFEKGNDTMRGSKGIGRALYELAGMIDRTRNEVVDRAIMSGKTLIQGEMKRIHTFKMSVIGATAVIPLGWNVLEQKIDGNVEPFLRLDAYFSSLADQLVGAVSPPKMEGEAFRSPVAWSLLAQREEEGRDARISRFLKQFVDMVETMQRRICNPDTSDEAAKAAQKQLREFLSPEEIKELAESPVATTVRDLTPIQRQIIAAVAAEKKGHPLYNQRQLEVEDLAARVNADFAERVLLPVNDPTEQVEQQRQQQTELILLSQGQPVPVSPRDNHELHLQILQPVAEGIAQQIMQGQADTAALEAVLAHITEHYNQAVQGGVDKKKLKPIADLVKQAQMSLSQLKQLDAQAAEVQAASEMHDAEELGVLPQ